MWFDFCCIYHMAIFALFIHPTYVWYNLLAGSIPGWGGEGWGVSGGTFQIMGETLVGTPVSASVVGGAFGACVVGA